MAWVWQGGRRGLGAGRRADLDAWGFIVAREKTAQQALDEAAPTIQDNLDRAWLTWEAEEGSA